MLSRVANSIYWMNRYLERADNVARFIRVNAHLVLDLGLERDESRWAPFIYASGDQEAFYDRYDKTDEKTVLYFLTFDEQNPNSIVSCVECARSNARTVREHIPSEIWETLNELYHFAHKHRRKPRIDDLQGFYEHFQRTGHLITGYAEDMMAHREAWHFARMGRMLERGDKTARLLDVKVFFILSNASQDRQTYDALEWGALLRSVNATEMYRKEHHTYDPRSVAGFLISNPLMPRSITYCVHVASRSLNSIVGTQDTSTPAQEEMAALVQWLDQRDVHEVMSSGLHAFIDHFQRKLNRLDEAIHQSFFVQQEALVEK